MNLFFQVSLYVLSRPEMLSVFNQILVVMTAFDTIYLALSVAEFSMVETFLLSSEYYDRVSRLFLLILIWNSLILILNPLIEIIEELRNKKERLE